MKANVYIDGFNLYRGCLKDTPYRWLDVSQLCRLLLPAHDINRIRYFTARVKPRPRNPHIADRQGVYLRALETIPNLSIHYGHFLEHKVYLPLVTPPPSGSRFVRVWKPEEKGSDVNLASYALLGAFDGDCEVAVFVTNDSDLLLPVRILRQRLGLTVGVLNPHRKLSKVLQAEADFISQIRAGPLSASQFPPTLTDSNGTFVKPPNW